MGLELSKVSSRGIWQINCTASARVRTKKEVAVRVTSRLRTCLRGNPIFWVQQGLGLVRVRVRVFMDVVLPMEVAVQICPCEPSNILRLSAVEASHTPQSVCANDDALENISRIVVTLDTSHLERSPLNDDEE